MIGNHVGNRIETAFAIGATDIVETLVTIGVRHRGRGSPGAGDGVDDFNAVALGEIRDVREHERNIAAGIRGGRNLPDDRLVRGSGGGEYVEPRQNLRPVARYIERPCSNRCSAGEVGLGEVKPHRIAPADS